MKELFHATLDERSVGARASFEELCAALGERGRLGVEALDVRLDPFAFGPESGEAIAHAGRVRLRRGHWTTVPVDVILAGIHPEDRGRVAEAISKATAAATSAAC